MSQQSALSRNRVVSALVLLSLLAALVYVRPASADPGFLLWTAIDTPSTLNNVIATPSEINAISIGSDDRTFYAVDIPAGTLYKSEDGGITWPNELSITGAMPIWNIAVAPDDVNFIVAITTIGTGPKGVYMSTDGGTTWQNSNLPLTDPANEFISCVDVSVSYGGTNRDIAVGTRTGGAVPAGQVYVMKSGGFSSWNPQYPSPIPSPSFDVVALKFSPTYPSDNGLVVVSSDASGTRLHLGARDIASNTTPLWDGAVAVGFPVELRDSTYPPANPSPNGSEIITADLELPSDFSAQNSALRRFYISDDSTTANRQVGIYRVDDSVPHLINSAIAARISSIAYYGTYAEGSLLAGEVTADPALGLVNIWRAVDCTVLAPAWLTSDTYKSPTGGGTSGYANAQLAWSPDGTRVYCGTSSACLGPYNSPDGNPDCSIEGVGEWPDGYRNGQQFDESAFSVSPYGPAYAQLLALYGKSEDSGIGNIWNQLSLIDTDMHSLSDVAVLEAPEGSSDYDILYVFSVSENATDFDSVWRSTSDPLGSSWERVLCIATNKDTILRVKQTTYEETNRSQAIIFAEVGADTVGTSQDEGQTWNIGHLTTVTDLALSTNTLMYVLNDTAVYRYTYTGSNWTYDRQADTQLAAGHTIAVPLKNPEGKDLVLVGEDGNTGYGRIAYIDFSETIIKAQPEVNLRIPPPVTGDAHVIFDDRFEQNGIIYNAIHDPFIGNGKIYRWTIEKSTAWDELEPPNTDFYGLVQRNDVLYGAWGEPQVTEIAGHEAGVDRTLYPRANVPPSLEWDYLVAGLPVQIPAIRFTHEPSSLKITSNQYVSLWAIDKNDYDFANNVGRLWEYTDIVAKLGPFTTAPPSGSDIPVDPKTGRAEEINFAWRQISYSTVYELQVAKDADFHNRVLVNENIIPTDQLSPVVYTPAGALIPASGSNIGSWANLESGHTYYWRVRARAAITGEQIRSPWSATMYFTVEAGLPTASPYPSVTLFNPAYGSINVSNTPAFSWSGMPKTTTYEFVMAKDAALQQVVVKADVPTTSYLYDGKLDYNTTYFWQVRALEPVVSDPSPIGTFTVMAAPKPVTPEVETPAPIPSWVWWIIAVITALIAAIIAYAMVKPGYSKPAAGGKLFKVEPVAEKPKEAILDKPKNPVIKIWNSIVMAVKRRRFLRKHTDKETSDSQDNLT
jgi:hypothetical protein